MKLTENELFELKYHYVDRYVDNMSTKDLVQYVFDDMLRYVEDLPEPDFLDDSEVHQIWEIVGKALDRNNIVTSDNESLSVRVYDELSDED